METGDVGMGARRTRRSVFEPALDFGDEGFDFAGRPRPEDEAVPRVAEAGL